MILLSHLEGLMTTGQLHMLDGYAHAMTEEVMRIYPNPLEEVFNTELIEVDDKSQEAMNNVGSHWNKRSL